MSASTYAGNAILNHMLRGVTFTAPARVWVSLHTADPGLTGASEVSTAAWPAYARQDPAQGAAVASGFAAASAKATVNAKQMLFPRHDGAAPVTVTHAVIWDALSGGNPLIKGVLVNPLEPTEEAPKTINPTDECVIYAGEMLVAVE